MTELAEIESADLGDAARQAAQEEAACRFLRDVVRGWEGVTDGQGRLVPFSPDRLDELDPTIVAELLRRIAEPPEELTPKKGRSGWQ